MFKRRCASIFLWAMVWGESAAAAPPPAPAPGPLIEQQQWQRQQEREKALRERLPSPADSLQAQPAPVALEIPQNESPCFALHSIQLTGPRLDAMPWLHDAAGLDREPMPCIGAKGVEIILARMQQALLEHGYITSRVMLAPQNLQGGSLHIALVPGVVRAVRFSHDSTGNTRIRTALPSRPGELLQLRDIEQGLENLQRVPTADAGIQIVPAEGPDAEPGQSDLLVRYQRAHPLRLNLALDDGGTNATGKLQGTATVSWDNPLQLNDLLYLSLGAGLANGGHRGTQSRVAHYSLPLAYWLLGLTGAYNRYHQNVAGSYQNYVYSGNSRQLDLQLSRVIHRTASSRTSVAVRTFYRTSSNYIDDTEIEVQRRRTAGYELRLSQRSYLGSAVFDAHLAFKRGTGAFAALRAPEEPWGEGSSRMKLTVADMALTRPFTLAGRRLKFSSAWHGQWNATPLTPQDRIGIGGRYTVRGFDGESSLLAERGWYWRNDIAMPLAAHAQAFLGLDTGRVNGPSARYLAGHSLTGAAIGLRGALRHLSYEVFLAAPIRKPEHFQTAHVSFAFNLAYSF